MDIRTITPDYAVSPQIAPDDIAAIVAAGFRTVICNRPDDEVTPAEDAAAVGKAARAAGLEFVVIPVTHPTMLDVVEAQSRAMDAADGPVLAYCASGTRCTILWAMAQAGFVPTDEIIASAAKAGYNISHLRPQIAALAEG